MKRLMIVGALVLLTSPALAQQQSPQEQALGAKLMEEIGQNVQYRAALIDAQAKVKDLQGQIDKRKKEDDEADAKKKAAEAASPNK